MKTGDGSEAKKPGWYEKQYAGHASPKDIINSETGQAESWADIMVRKLNARDKAKQIEDEDFWKSVGGKPKTQKQLRELRRQQRQAEAERAKLTQQDILNKCAATGSCVVTMDDLKNAFPNLIHQIDNNAYRTQIDNKLFHAFLVSNGLMFSLPDFVFRKTA
jgi:hypothetical protein